MSWDQLLSIYDKARRELADERAQPPAACPNDGEPLEATGTGTWHCRFGGEIFSSDGTQLDG